ncbi:MAG: hypothetical protein Q8M94_11645 [Ignavibacteria bacterium]|nr:hypothetical protein [Ignavibacteria bacterium]
MFTITAKVLDIKTTAGSYKNKLIAERHKRRLEKKYPGTTFEIIEASASGEKCNQLYLKKRGKRKDDM